jgi:hypothetical protein
MSRPRASTQGRMVRPFAPHTEDLGGELAEDGPESVFHRVLLSSG